MKYTPLDWNNLNCPTGVKVKPLANETCTLADICKSSSNTNPDQGWRFLVPTFLHSGVVHFVINGFFQLRVATVFEKEMGALKTAIVFFVSSVGGYIFGGAFSVSANDTPSVGSSGGLFGIIACLTTDIFTNWSLLKDPKWEASKTILNIIVAFVMGWLPGVDNFSHIGGYICGLIMAPLIMTNSYVSKEDRQRKKILQYLSLPCLALFFAICLYGFYKLEMNCPACQYLNCVPGLPWYVKFSLKIGVSKKV
jgi:membrane associated rhomboid family serine protease